MAFEARYPGRCVSCEEMFAIGERIKYNASNQLAHEGCSDQISEPVMVRVMPRGRTLSDRCQKGCFQIPAANGQCGCDS
jgi:hypothetical protein